MDGFGEHYDELWLGLGSVLPGSVRVGCRNDNKTVFFYCEYGLFTAQKIETLEFDGWEVFDEQEHSVERYESTRDARSAILKAYYTRIEDG